ncbi:head GIN domain-containing protein [soil metagenome]
MYRWYWWSSFALMGMLLAACGLQVINGSGNVVTEARPVSNFNAVSLSGTGELTIIQGESEALTVEAEDNVMSHLRTEVRNGTLTLGLAHESWLQVVRPTQPIKFKLTVKKLTDLDLSGSGSIQAATLTTDQLAVTVSGSGDLEFAQLAATNLTCTISGSGKAQFAGAVTGQTVVISGNGDYQAGNLKSQTGQITVSGSGQVTVWVQTALDVEISGSGMVNYYGAPKLSTEISGSGQIKDLGDK